MNQFALLSLIPFTILSLSSCTTHSPADALNAFKAETGLHEVPGNESMLEGKVREYPVLFQAQMGDVWGRYPARTAICEKHHERACGDSGSDSRKPMKLRSRRTFEIDSTNFSSLILKTCYNVTVFKNRMRSGVR